MTQISPLRRRMIDDMTIRNLSPATQQSYVYAVAKLGQLFKCSPERLDLADVRAFQVHLVASGISWSALNQTVCALRFLYGVTLGRPDLPKRIPHAREPRKLPVVLGADEVVRFLEAVPSLKCRAALITAYAAGLRASEVASLEVANIDSSRMVIRVEQGKGGKDRYVVLSAQLLGILCTYWRLAHPAEWLFPGRDPGHSIHPAVLHAACRSACSASGLSKRVNGPARIGSAASPPPPGRHSGRGAPFGTQALYQNRLLQATIILCDSSAPFCLQSAAVLALVKHAARRQAAVAFGHA